MSLKIAAGVQIPADLVLVGYVSGAYGIHGWVRIRPYSADADALLNAKKWWFDRPDVHRVDVIQAKLHVDDVVAQLVGVSGRDAAEALKGTAIQISRSHFPALADGEFYWVDLIGLDVSDLGGAPLGIVQDLMSTGAHPILRVAVVDLQIKDKPVRELLIPFVDQFVKTVDLQARKITVDWSLDY
ncbi:MAG: ribosome maturation factor RimM [Glaciimonas sp.]|nr:ribosome maturation factor RimM [Glaciimonas sp.]